MRFEVPEWATPINDASGLKVSWVQTMGDLNRVEAENISFAQKKYLRASPRSLSSWFHYTELCAIHRAMFGKVWDWAGKQRTNITSIGVSPGLISLQIAELCEEVTSWEKEPIELTFLERGAIIHHRLVKIHPFENGNGRFSRLVADRCLYGWKCSYPNWPENLNREGQLRAKYIEALRAADKGNYEPLIGFMKDLGAEDPSICTLFQDRFYRPFMDGLKGVTLVRALLRRGENPSRHHPLQLVLKAKLERQNKLEILKMLINRGAQVDAKDKSGLTPFQVAVAQGENDIALLLKSEGARALEPAFALEDPQAEGREDGGESHDDHKSERAFGKGEVDVHSVNTRDHRGDAEDDGQ